MNALTAWVISNGVALLYDVLASLGFGQDDTNAILSFFYGVMVSPAGGYVAFPLAIVIWVWQQAQNISTALPSWVTWLYNEVTNNIDPVLNWVVGRIQDLNSILQGVTTGINDAISAAVQSALNAWANVLNYAGWLYYNASSILTQFVSDPAGFIGAIASQAINTLYPLLGDLFNFYTAVIRPALNFLTQFLTDPVQFITGIFNQLIDAALVPLRPVLDFIAWWQDVGQQFLIALINDPVKVILDIIAPAFIDWLMKLIADNW